MDTLQTQCRVCRFGKQLGQGSGLAIQMYRRLLADPVLHNDDNNDLADPFD